MIHPYTVGPMSLAGFTWYQGEANIEKQGFPWLHNVEGAEKYSCMFPGLISAWRERFHNIGAYFGFIQLSTMCEPRGSEDIAEMRTIGQMSALAVPKVGYSTNVDHGAGCNIHPPSK